MTIKCVRCGTTTAHYWVDLQYNDSAEDETQTIIYCQKCYEKEAINGI